MRRDNRLTGSMVWYLAVVLLVGGVVLLWAAKVTWPVAAISFGVIGALLLLFALGPRRAPTLLVVGEPVGEPVTVLREALEDAGFDLCVCAGPANSPCPVEHGKLCPLGDRPVAALIYRPAGETGPLAPCGRAFLIPSLAVEGDTDRPPEFAGRYARVGWKRGSDEVVHALEDLLAV